MRLGAMFMDIVKSFFTPPVTEKYPFEKPKTAPRFRGRLHFDPAKCTGCNLCAKDCPADALEIVILDRAAKRYVARYNIDKCAYCGQCIQSCKFKCITMPNNDWELAALSKEKFTAYYGKDDDVANLMDKLAHPEPIPQPKG